MTRVSPNGTTVEVDTFVLDGLRVRREAHSGGPFAALESLWLYTLDGRRVVGVWMASSDGLKAATLSHYRDTGDDALGPVELEDLVAAAHAAWPCLDAGAPSRHG